MTHDRKKRPRKGVIICGAYGMENAGDDAVLTSIIAELRRIGGTLPITVMSRRPRETARRFGIDAVHPMNFPRWLRLMKRSALFLSGGGSLLQDVTSCRSLFYYLSAIRSAHARGCAVQLYGCGIGPLVRPRSRRKTARTLNECVDIITLRDGGSAALLASIGVVTPRILTSADPAISLPSAAGARERSAGFALRDWPGFREHAPDIAGCAAYIWETYGLTPLFFCLSPADRAPARAVCDILSSRDIPCRIADDLSRSERTSLFISMRLHGLIFALRGGVPAGGISYDPKVAAFCEESGLPVLSLSEADTDRLSHLADMAMHLDADALSRTAAELRRREMVNGRAAAELLSAETPSPHK